MSGKIVVGIDGSSGSIEALRFAIDEARRRGSEVVALHAWELPVSAIPVTAAAAWSMHVDWDEFRAEAERELKAAVAEVDSEAVTVTPVVVEGPASAALLAAADDAEMLVVGSRGRGGFASLLLGSVSSQVAHHATCPIVIVPTRGAVEG